MNGTETAISVRGLEKEFRLGFAQNKRFKALDGVSLEIGTGRTLGFLGPNGAGKTTTIKIITGLIFPSAGSVEIFGKPASDAHVRKRYGYLPENPSFHDHLTGREVLEFFAELLGISRAERPARIDAVLAQVNLSHAADMQVRRYSKGMTQRLGLAQALVHEPELVILDEPMSGLDPVGRRDVKDLIRKLRAQRRTVFFSTHIISDVEELCDDVAIVVGGKVVRAGPVSSYLQSEVREVEVLALGVPADFPEIGNQSPSGTVSFRAPDQASARKLAEALWARGAQVTSLSARRYNLEDVFMAEVAKRPNPRRTIED